MKKILKSRYCLFLAGILLCFYLMCVAEHNPNFGSLGEEMRHAMITAGFSDLVFSKELNSYYLKRILPPGLIHYTIKALNKPFTVENIEFFFGLYNCLMLMFMIWIWILLSKELKLSLKGAWLGFLALFCNFAILKGLPYDMVTTDVYAYFIGLSMVYFFLRNNFIALFLLATLGTFAWPTPIYLGVLLLLFPRDDEGSSFKNSPKVPFKLHWLVALIPTVYILTQDIQNYKWMYHGNLLNTGVFSMGTNKPLKDVIFLSIGISLIYVFVGWMLLLRNGKFADWKYWWSKVGYVRWPLAIIALVAMKILIKSLANGVNRMPFDYIVHGVIIGSIMQPASFLVSNIAYFGPFYIFIILLWKPIAQLIQRYGGGLVICVCICLGFSLCSEARRSINFYPFVLPFCIAVLDKYQWKRWQGILLGVIVFVFSKAWILTYHAQPWGNNIFKLPNQLYYMNYGLWMSHEMYYLQGGIILLSATILYFTMIFRIPQLEEKCEDDKSE